MNKNNNKKSSFDRFGDDLAELILKQLSLKDQLSLECVSKQFQSCGIQQRTRITAKDKANLIMKTKWFYFFKDYFSTTKWRSLMKKCPNVSIVEITCEDYRTDILRAIHRQWRTLWPRLRRIDCMTIGMTGKDIEFWCQSFTEMFTQLSIYGENEFQPMKPSITNLRDLSVGQLDHTFIGDRLIFKGLRRFSCYSLNNQVIQFKAFIDGNSNLQIVSLSFHFTDTSDTVVNVLTHIGRRLQGLQRLEILFFYPINYSIVQSLTIIANNCRQLKYLWLRITVDSLDNYLETYRAVKQMRHLKRLDLNLRHYLNNIDNNQLIDFKLYKTIKPDNCWPQLTHLSLELSLIDKQFFTHFYRNLPKLQYLSINDPNGSVFDCTCMSYIARLKSLTTLLISINNNDLVISDTDVHQVIIGCPKLQSIKISVKQTLYMNYNDIKIYLLRKLLKLCV